MMKYLALGVAAALCGVLPAAASTTALDSARRVCQAADEAGSVKPCRISATTRIITVTLNMDRDEARVACFGMHVGIQQHGLHFPGKNWTIQIRSGKGKLLTWCTMPN